MWLGRVAGEGNLGSHSWEKAVEERIRTGNTGSIDDIIESKLGDERAGLEEERERL